MEPRLSSSKKWTPVPQDYKDQVMDVLKSSFAAETARGEWIFEGHIYAEELLLRIGFLERGRLRQINFEISIQFRAGKDNVPDLLGLGVDVGASLLEDAFKAENDSEFPRTWQEFTVERRAVFIQYSAVNSRLEEEADRLLGIQEEGLIRATDSTEDAAELLKHLKKTVGIDEDDDLDIDDEDDDIPKKPVH